MDISAIRASIAATPGVGGVHDLHVWSLSSDEHSLSTHVELANGADFETVRTAVAKILHDRYEIEHATIQVEREACDDADGLHR
ncbi:hypothetical protein [Sphingomonas rhizophila]|uniref:cation transporter dimerization domain-containing protein n=1 Tax=Sphingomonas rhizophila TaxID=2071607 RepID=UPI0024833615|nr:hypothetical protein [Sphingomonas rhizophila]